MSYFLTVIMFNLFEVVRFTKRLPIFRESIFCNRTFCAICTLRKAEAKFVKNWKIWKSLKTQKFRILLKKKSAYFFEKKSACFFESTLFNVEWPSNFSSDGFKRRDCKNSCYLFKVLYLTFARTLGMVTRFWTQFGRSKWFLISPCPRLSVILVQNYNVWKLWSERK